MLATAAKVAKDFGVNVRVSSGLRHFTFKPQSPILSGLALCANRRRRDGRIGRFWATFRANVKLICMTTLLAHFDGHVLVPEEPVDLPQGRLLRVQVEEETITRHSPASGL